MKKLKPYKPHYTIMAELMASPTQPLPEFWRNTQLKDMKFSLEQMARGDNPNEVDWRRLSDAVNLTETLVTTGIAEDATGLLQDAITALAESGLRYRNGMPLRLSGPGLHVVRQVLENYEFLINNLSARTMIRCHRLTEKAVSDVLRGKGKQTDITVFAL